LKNFFNSRLDAFFLFQKYATQKNAISYIHDTLVCLLELGDEGGAKATYSPVGFSWRICATLSIDVGFCRSEVEGAKSAISTAGSIA
jgi:hypothetical protein